MADLITRNISALPFAGGTMLTAQPTQTAVILTANRMVWTYCQTTPAWRFFSIIDTPEGWATGGNPVVTSNRMFDQRQYSGTNLLMFRLNDSTFCVMEGMSNVNNYKVEVFQIDANNVISRLWSNLDTYGNVVTNFLGGNLGYYGGAGTRFSNTSQIMPIADNKVLHLFLDSTRRLNTQVLTWDPVGMTLTGPTATILAGTLDYSGAPEITIKPIPGSTKMFVNARTLNSNSTWEGGASISTVNFVFNADGTLSNSIGWTGSAPNAAVGTGYCIDTTAMSETRMARLNWGNAYYYNMDGITSQGYAPVGNSTSTKAMMAYAIDANYNLLIERTHFTSNGATPLNIKVFRRDDSNITSQSAASATSATGYSVTAPYIDTWRYDPRPRMQANGDLFWWGLDTTGTKLSWNILKNPTA